MIATRNRRQMLSEAVASVQEQSFRDWELIVVDDASTDDTAEYLAALADERIRALRQSGHGERSAARNRGLAEARGELIMFLDDDDMLRATALEKMAGALRAHPSCVAAVGACRIFVDEGDTVKAYHPARASVRRICRELLFEWWANSGQNLYRTSVVRDVGGFDVALSVVEDRKLWLAVASRGEVCLVPQVTMDYRQHGGQWKPPNIKTVRDGVYEEFIATLPKHEQAAAWRIRRATERNKRAQQARSEGKFGVALMLQLGAILSAPRLLASPLTGPPLWWELKKSLLRTRTP